MDDDSKIWRLEFLGRIRAVSKSKTIDRFQTQKTSALLAYLALRKGSQPREELIDLLWPDADANAGRNRLSQALAWLRANLDSGEKSEPPLFHSDRWTVELNPVLFQCDVLEFQQISESVPVPEGDQMSADSRRASQLEQAIGLYRGSFMPGAFDEWILSLRRQLFSTY